MIKNRCADRIDTRGQCTCYPRQAAAPNLSQQSLNFFLRGRISQPAKPITSVLIIPSTALGGRKAAKTKPVAVFSRDITVPVRTLICRAWLDSWTQ